MDPSDNQNLPPQTPAPQPVPTDPALPESHQETQPSTANPSQAVDTPAILHPAADDASTQTPNSPATLMAAPSQDHPTSTQTPPTSKQDSSIKTLFQRWQTWIYVALGALSIIALAFGVFELSENMQAQDRLKSLEQEVAEKDRLIVKYAAQIGQQVEDSSRPGYINPANNTAQKGYIYIGEWGIKIKIPSSLKYVSYDYKTVLTQTNDEISTVCVWATPRSLENIPAFADPSQNPNGLGCATRYNSDSASSSAQGKTFYQYGKYFYRYTSKNAISKDEAERVLEEQTIEAIQNMFTTENFTTF